MFTCYTKEIVQDTYGKESILLMPTVYVTSAYHISMENDGVIRLTLKEPEIEIVNVQEYVQNKLFTNAHVLKCTLDTVLLNKFHNNLNFQNILNIIYLQTGRKRRPQLVFQSAMRYVRKNANETDNGHMIEKKETANWYVKEIFRQCSMNGLHIEIDVRLADGKLVRLVA
jgi:hypothetical protein